MAFRVPTFNLLCNIVTIGAGPFPPAPGPPYRLTNQPCALVYGRRVSTMLIELKATPTFTVACMHCLLPALTDVRGIQDTVAPDLLECPAGSGRWYVVTSVDDIGKGYPNEHRTAEMFTVQGSWTAPYP
jgi:hypothetical protein